MRVPSEPPIRIRRFVPGDEPALFEIFHSAIHLIARQVYTQAQVDAWAPAEVDAERWAARLRGIQPFVAEMDSMPVGYADLQANGCVDHFFVSGRHPRQGIGRLLMDVIQAEAKRLQIPELSSDVARSAQPFFECFGWQVVEQQMKVVRGVELPNARMHKVLG